MPIYPLVLQDLNTTAATGIEYDAIIIGGGVGGLTAAAQMAAQGAHVLVLEKWVHCVDVGHSPVTPNIIIITTDASVWLLHTGRYLVPGGSAAHFKREGYTFDVSVQVLPEAAVLCMLAGR